MKIEKYSNKLRISGESRAAAVLSLLTISTLVGLIWHSFYKSPTSPGIYINVLFLIMTIFFRIKARNSWTEISEGQVLSSGIFKQIKLTELTAIEKREVNLGLGVTLWDVTIPMTKMRQIGFKGLSENKANELVLLIQQYYRHPIEVSVVKSDPQKKR